jgi:hypothetical protein
VFGLINSTPHSRHLGRAGMATMLCEMALGALDRVRVDEPTGLADVG